MASLLVPVAPEERFCTICGKQYARDALLVKDCDLCPECRKTYGGMAFVYCNSCRKVVSRVMPGMAPSGFLVKPGDLLHVPECPICNPVLTSVMSEEQKAYEKDR